MLSLPNDGRHPALALTPEQRRQRTLEALTAQVAGLASQQPVLMIFEDAQWTDPTSLEAFGRTVDRIKILPVLLIVTFRPEFNPPWVGQSRVTSVTLNRLGEREAAAIIARLVGNKELPADVMAEIVERSRRRDRAGFNVRYTSRHRRGLRIFGPTRRSSDPSATTSSICAFAVARGAGFLRSLYGAN